MNEQQLAAVKQALEALESFDGVGDVVTWEKQWKLCIKAHESLQSIISQDALDKKADNARELGLSYDTPLSSFVRSSDEAKAEVMERVIDKATEEQKAVIDCDQCKAVQEQVKPYAYEYGRDNGDGTYSVVIDKGSLVQTQPAVYNYVRPQNAHKDWPIKELFDRPPAAQPAYTKEDIDRAFSAGLVEGEKLAIEAAAQPAVPLTERDLASACLSYRHDFGLMDETNRGLLMFQAREWARAFGLSITAAPPAAQPAPVPLTDEQIQLVVSQAVSAETLSWLGYKKDADGKYTVPVLSPSDYQFARAIEAAHGITATPTQGETK